MVSDDVILGNAIIPRIFLRMKMFKILFLCSDYDLTFQNLAVLF